MIEKNQGERDKEKVTYFSTKKFEDPLLLVTETNSLISILEGSVPSGKRWGKITKN